MNLQYKRITQTITQVLSYRGHAIVALENGRVGIVPEQTLSKAGINPNDGPANESMAARITAMRVALEGKDALVKAKGDRLFITGLYTRPLEIPVVEATHIDQICRAASSGAPIDPGMSKVIKFLSRSRDARLRRWSEAISRAFDQRHASPRLLPLGESLVGAYAS